MTLARRTFIQAAAAGAGMAALPALLPTARAQALPKIVFGYTAVTDFASVFIASDAGEDIFVHFSAIASDGFHSLAEGDRVEFDVVPGAKGKQAANLSRV